MRYSNIVPVQLAMPRKPSFDTSARESLRQCRLGTSPRATARYPVSRASLESRSYRPSESAPMSASQPMWKSRRPAS